MTPPFPASSAAAQPPRTALLIDRNLRRLADARHALAQMPGYRILDSITDTADGLIRSVRLKPDFILLGWSESGPVMATLVGMMKQFCPGRPVVLVTSDDAEAELARRHVAQASGVLLPGQLPANLASAIGRSA